MLDVRFLPNPFYKAELRQHNGLEEPVRDYLFQYEETAAFLSKLEDLSASCSPCTRRRGRAAWSLRWAAPAVSTVRWPSPTPLSSRFEPLAIR